MQRGNHGSLGGLPEYLGARNTMLVVRESKGRVVWMKLECSQLSEDTHSNHDSINERRCLTTMVDVTPDRQTLALVVNQATR